MEVSVKERLKLFLKKEGIKDVDFCRIIGVSTGFISGMRVQIKKHCNKFPQIRYWLASYWRRLYVKK